LVIIRKVINDSLDFFHNRKTQARCNEYQDECAVNDTEKGTSERKCKHEHDALNCAIRRACVKFFQIAPSIKNADFYHEKEWRLISKPRKLDSYVKYRGKPRTIPYIEINLSNSKDESLCWIPEIWIGPKAKKRKPYDELENLLLKEDLRKSELEKLLSDNKVSYNDSSTTEVIVSIIPIRANEACTNIKDANKKHLINLYNKWKRTNKKNEYHG